MTQCKDCGKEISKVSTRCNPCASKKRWGDPEFRARRSEEVKQQWKNPEFRAKQAKLKKQRWEDPEYRKMMSETTKQQWKDPEFRAMQIERTRQLWEAPEFRAMRSEQVKQQWEDPKFRAKICEQTKQLWDDPEFRVMKSEHTSEQLKQQWEEPEYRAKMSEMSRQQWEDPEYRATISGYSKQRWENPEYRAMKSEQMSGENNPNWQGGKSLVPYGTDWTDELKEEIRKRDEYTCAISGEVWQLGQPAFHVHHIDGNKRNSIESNLITLCQSCHSKTNSNRRHWQALLTPIAKGAEMRANASVV